MTIALYRGTDFISKSILWFSRGGYSHAAILLNDGRIVEAYPFKGVRLRQSISDQMNHTTVDIFECPTTVEQNEIIENFLTMQVGKGYDYLSIAGFVFHTTKEGRKQLRRWICSELVFATFQKAGINLLDRIDAWKVSPTILSYSTKMVPVATIKI